MAASAEGDAVSTPRGRGTVVKRAGMRVRVEHDGGATNWFELHEVHAAAMAGDSSGAAPLTGGAALPTTETLSDSSGAALSSTETLSVERKALRHQHMEPATSDSGSRLSLPSEDPEVWSHIVSVLSRGVERLTDLDAMMTEFAALDREPRRCTFFADIPGSAEAGRFDFELFLAKGAPLLIEVALEMPRLFADVSVPIHKTNAAWPADGGTALHRRSTTLTRRQCACLLAHSVLGSLKRPADVQPNDFRFTAVELFIGTARSPNSATTLLNYFSWLGRHGFAEGDVTFERQGYAKAGAAAPWAWEASDAPLCAVHVCDGALEESAADVHAEFANAFVGGGVMTGDFAMEEILFLVKPELMIAMAVQVRRISARRALLHAPPARPPSLQQARCCPARRSRPPPPRMDRRTEWRIRR
jgi:hypothetical protein